MSAESLVATPGQTIGPFFGFALPYEGGEQLIPPGHPDAVRLTGLVLDGHGKPVPDAMIEIWQADADGRIEPEPGSLRRDGYTFTGWGRAATDRTGHYQFSTLRPGALSPGAAPYFAITVFARGLLDRLFTRAYLPGAAQWPSLAATADDRGFVFDIRLQGEGETVFLTYAQD